jgi:hypothetical protein
MEEVKACTQKHSESLCSYIRRWSVIKNLSENVSDERAIDAFINGLRRQDFVEEIGRSNPKTVSALMDIANKFMDDEYAYHNKQTRSPKDDRSQRYNSQKCKTRNYDEYKGSSQVAVGFRSNNDNQGDKHQSGGYRNDNRDEPGSSRQQYRTRTSRDYNQSPEDILNGPCNMHLLELCPRGNNKDVIIIILVHDNVYIPC